MCTPFSKHGHGPICQSHRRGKGKVRIGDISKAGDEGTVESGVEILQFGPARPHLNMECHGLSMPGNPTADRKALVHGPRLISWALAGLVGEPWRVLLQATETRQRLRFLRQSAVEFANAQLLQLQSLQFQVPVRLPAGKRFRHVCSCPSQPCQV